MVAIKAKRGFMIWTIAVPGFAFGLLTVKEGAAVLFGNEAARVAAGNYVPFVLWFNFLAGFVYLIAAAGLWLRQPWAVYLSGAIAVATAIMFAGLGVHIYSGGAYETRTVIAMSLRTLVWLVITGVAFRIVRHR